MITAHLRSFRNYVSAGLPIATGLVVLSLVLNTAVGFSQWHDADGKLLRVEYSQRGFPLTLVTRVWSDAPASAVRPEVWPLEALQPLRESGADPTIGTHIHFWNAAITAASALMIAAACVWAWRRWAR